MSNRLLSEFFKIKPSSPISLDTCKFELSFNKSLSTNQDSKPSEIEKRINLEFLQEDIDTCLLENILVTLK